MNFKNIDKKELFKLLGIFVLMIVAGYGCFIALGVIVSISSSLGGITLPFIAYSAVLYVPMIAIAILYSTQKGDNFWKDCEFKKIKVSTVLLTILLTVVSYPLVMFFNYFSMLFAKNAMADTVDVMVGNSPVLYMIALAVVAPVCEEILLRGFLHNRMKKIIPFTAAAILSGFWFGVIHMNINQFCYAWVLGIIFAYVNRASGSIFTSLIMHFCINLFGGIVNYLSNIYYKAQGTSLAETSEGIRGDSSKMLGSLLVLGALSVVSFFLTRLIIRAIAKREGGNDIATKEDAVA